MILGKILYNMQYFWPLYYMSSHDGITLDTMCRVHVIFWLSPGTGGLRLLDGDLVNARLVDPVDDRVSQLTHQLGGANTQSHTAGLQVAALTLE